MAYNKANTGSLYNNNYKKKDDQPDFTGTLYLDASFLQEMIEATEVGEFVVVSVSGWKSTLPSGDPVTNLKIKKPWKKEDKPEPKPAPKPEPKPEPEVDDEDLPF
jgi:hypothetical protein